MCWIIAYHFHVGGNFRSRNKFFETDFPSGFGTHRQKRLQIFHSVASVGQLFWWGPKLTVRRLSFRFSQLIGARRFFPFRVGAFSGSPTAGIVSRISILVPRGKCRCLKVCVCVCFTYPVVGTQSKAFQICILNRTWLNSQSLQGHGSWQKSLTSKGRAFFSHWQQQARLWEAFSLRDVEIMSLKWFPVRITPPFAGRFPFEAFFTGKLSWDFLPLFAS